MTDRLLRREEVESRVAFTRSSIYRLMRAHAFPEPVKVGPRAVRWLVLCSQSLFRFADLGDDGLCRGGPGKGCGVIVSAIDVVVDRLD